MSLDLMKTLDYDKFHKTTHKVIEFLEELGNVWNIQYINGLTDITFPNIISNIQQSLTSSNMALLKNTFNELYTDLLTVGDQYLLILDGKTPCPETKTVGVTALYKDSPAFTSSICRTDFDFLVSINGIRKAINTGLNKFKVRVILINLQQFFYCYLNHF